MMVAIVVLAFGLLALARSYVGVTAAGSQNQNLSNMAAAGNAFWGIVQANPGMLTGAPALANTYTSANIGSAPAALQPWLTGLLVTAPGALPQGSAVIATGPDAASGAACSSTTGCTVTLTLNWVQGAKAGSVIGGDVTRAQTFYFQFGL